MSDNYNIKLCDKCIQMTNHLNGICQKCKTNNQMSNDTNMDNRILAEFHGWERDAIRADYTFKQWSKYFFTTEQMQYHKSYDWLMPVWEKFRALSVPYPQHEKHLQWIDKVAHTMAYGTLTDFYNALVNAVKWYNEVKK